MPEPVTKFLCIADITLGEEGLKVLELGDFGKSSLDGVDKIRVQQGLHH